MSDLLVREANTGAFGLTNVDTWADATNGLGAINDIVVFCDETSKDGWMGEMGALVSLGLNVVSALVNPIATGVGWVVSWIIDHISPLPEWLQELTGDPEEISAGASTWMNISQAAQNQARDLVEHADSFVGQTSQALTAYSNRIRTIAKIQEIQAQAAAQVAGALQKQAGIVRFIYDFVRDLISEAIGMFIQSVAETVFSLGTATPAVVAQISTWVGSKVTKVKDLIRKGLDAFSKLSSLTSKLVSGLRSAGSLVSKFASLAGKPGDFLQKHAKKYGTELGEKAPHIAKKLNEHADDVAKAGKKAWQIDPAHARGKQQLRKSFENLGVDVSNPTAVNNWFESMPPSRRAEFAKSLSGNEAHEIFRRMSPKEQVEFLRHIPDPAVADEIAKKAGKVIVGENKVKVPVEEAWKNYKEGMKLPGDIGNIKKTLDGAGRVLAPDEYDPNRK